MSDIVDRLVAEGMREREAHPERGDRPGPDEEGSVRCEHGHGGPLMAIDPAVKFDGPKGEFHPYCISCINLYVIKLAKLKPMKFYIKKRSAAQQLIVPHGSVFPKDLPKGLIQ